MVVLLQPLVIFLCFEFVVFLNLCFEVDDVCVCCCNLWFEFVVYTTLSHDWLWYSYFYEVN